MHPNLEKPFSNIFIRVCVVIFFSVAFGTADEEWRTFKSAENDQSFTGRIVSYDASSRLVVVLRKGASAPVKFSIDKLSQPDQKFVLEVARQKEIARYLHITFDRAQSPGERSKDSNADATITTTTYKAGYRIRLGNFGPAPLTGITVEYLLVWNKAPNPNAWSSGMGFGEKTHKGTMEVAPINKGATTVMETDSLTLETVSKKGKNRIERDSKGVQRQVLPNQTDFRSNDTLDGCVVWVKADGKVVTVAASSPKLLNRFAKNEAK